MHLANNPWSPSRGLHRWAVLTAAATFGLLALGSVVTSFRVGMADPVWPTRPWHLLTISWDEPKPGFVIEHVHRLAGFIVGAVVSVLTLWLWLTEPKKTLRYTGVLALVALLAAFGQLHGSLIKQQRLSAEAGELLPPDWTIALGPTLAALAVVVILTGVMLCVGSPGRGLRVLGVVLLVAVMVQGMLGGLRVYLNALFGTDLAAVHGSFSQVVFALTVAVAVLTARRKIVPADDAWTPDAGTARAATLAAVAVYGQIVCGAVLRHGTTAWGPRLHLLVAFLAVIAVFAAVRALRDAPAGVRRLGRGMVTLTVVQLMLGVEAWMARFAGGLTASQWQPVNVPDAVTRSAHVLVGYTLFGAAVALAVTIRRARPAAAARPARSVPVLEGVA
jgi:heme A synthase